MYKKIVDFIRYLYNTKDFIPLHAPVFVGNEKEYLNDCIDSTYVSYVGPYVTKFENMVTEYTCSKYAISTVNGTVALQIALLLAGVKKGDEVLTQALTFVATSNAISYCCARPIFLDSEKETLGMCPEKLEYFLEKETVKKDDGFCYNKKSGKRIASCVPMHVFGHPVRIDEINNICKKYNISLVEDSAESLGSTFKGKHTGTFGKLGIISFNGNKIITTGGGGMILTDDESMAKKAKHLTTTAKKPHKWEFIHDEIGYNYRLPNINAAVGCAQMENLSFFQDNKRKLADIYRDFFNKLGIDFFCEQKDCRSNYWLNAIIFKNRNERDSFLNYSNEKQVMARPVWRLISNLELYKNCQCGNLENAQWLEDRIVNIPSGVRI